MDRITNGGVIMETVSFRHGALSETYEKQANQQGYTFGEYADFVQKVGFGIIAGHINGIITESEYDKILKRFGNKILVKYLKPLKP